MSLKYIQPGLELISLDPKRSISVIGPETFGDEEMMKTSMLLFALRPILDSSTKSPVSARARFT